MIVRPLARGAPLAYSRSMTATSLPYVKMNGAGNDFIILRVEAPGLDLSPETVRRLCGRDTAADDDLRLDPPQLRGQVDQPVAIGLGQVR